MTWPAFRTEPVPAGRMTLGRHLGTVVLSMATWSWVGLVMMGLGTLASFVSAGLAEMLQVGGALIGMSFLFTWLGYLMGAPLLHVALRRGVGGWGVALGLGLLVGLLWSAAMRMWRPALLGPLMAFAYGWVLRRIPEPADTGTRPQGAPN